MKERLDLTFIAAAEIDPDILLNEDRFIQTYLLNDQSGHPGMETGYIDTEENLAHLMTFLFGTNFKFQELAFSKNRKVVDLTAYKHECITQEQFEENYLEWIKLSGRENTMDEYGNIVCIIGYITKKIDKKHLAVIIEKRVQLTE